ncbi:MAG: hypothetical protein GTN78_07060 [Gemmatimonadales bacterium]|nr:hypothetical protein [Gemmatimonadales bacterium]
MLRTSGRAIQVWRAAMAAWRRTGDVSELVEAASGMEPMFRRVFLDSVLPAGLRNDLESLLRDRARPSARQRGAA